MRQPARRPGRLRRACPPEAGRCCCRAGVPTPAGCCPSAIALATAETLAKAGSGGAEAHSAAVTVAVGRACLRPPDVARCSAGVWLDRLRRPLARLAYSQPPWWPSGLATSRSEGLRDLRPPRWEPGPPGDCARSELSPVGQEPLGPPKPAGVAVCLWQT